LLFYSQTALELVFSDGSSLFLNFPAPGANAEVKEVTNTGAPSPVREVFSLLLRMIRASGGELRRSYLTDPASELRRRRATEAWALRRISNLEYLMELNALAGRRYLQLFRFLFIWIRLEVLLVLTLWIYNIWKFCSSFNDLTQYPVVPWVRRRQNESLNCI
jgi:hypothetical protein